jgi:AP2-associated kinase
LPPKPKKLQTGGSATSPTKAVSSVREKQLGADGEEWDVDTFAKRYPSLSGLEMVETEIPKGRIRDV